MRSSEWMSELSRFEREVDALASALLRGGVAPAEAREMAERRVLADRQIRAVTRAKKEVDL